MFLFQLRVHFCSAVSIPLSLGLSWLLKLLRAEPAVWDSNCALTSFTPPQTVLKDLLFCCKANFFISRFFNEEKERPAMLSCSTRAGTTAHLVSLTVCHINAVIRGRDGDIVKEGALAWAAQYSTVQYSTDSKQKSEHGARLAVLLNKLLFK